MDRITWSLAGLFVMLGAVAAPADIELRVTTDADANDNGGIDEFVAIPDDGVARTVYIWGKSTPAAEDGYEFNFDLSSSGSGLTFSNAAIGPFFTGVDMSMSEADLGDLQFGWSAFFGTPPSVPTSSFTLFATVEVAIAAETPPGAGTTIELAGGAFTMLDSTLADIPTTGTSRNLLPQCVSTADCDDGEPCTGNGICQPDGTCVQILAADCNVNYLEDACDIAGGTTPDADYNGIPDECENWSHCVSGEGFFDYGPHRANEEAEFLAMTLSGELRAPDEEYDRILRDLQLARDAYPVLEIVTYTPEYAPDLMVVRLESPGPWPGYDGMNTFYQIIEDSVLIQSLNIRLVTFCDNLNIQVLAPEYETVPEVMYAEPSGIAGYESQITIEVLGGTYRYTFYDGFDDCLGGCRCARTWVIDVYDGGFIALVSYDEVGAGLWCVYEDIACCLDGLCSMMPMAQCLGLGGVPLALDVVCDGDVDEDGLDGACGDNCPDDTNKIDPGVCGCGIADTDSDGDGTLDCLEPIPAASTWGLIVMALLLLAAGQICIERRPATSASPVE